MGQQKKDTLESANKAASSDVTYKCGDCLHYEKHQHLQKSGLCKNLGVRTFAIAPRCFSPDITQIAGNSETFAQVAMLYSDYTPKQRRILLAVLKQPQKKFKRELPFGTRVFFHGLGKDYISNYMSGYVAGTTSSGELIVTGSPDRNARGRMYFAYMNDAENLMTFKEWKVKRNELKEAGRVQDPQSMIIPKGSVLPELPVTIDSAPDAWYSKQEKTKKKRGVQELVIKIS